MKEFKEYAMKSLKGATKFEDVYNPFNYLESIEINIK